MKVVSFYHKDSGILNGVQIIASNEKAIEINTPKDHLPIEGHLDPLWQRVDIATGKVIDYHPPRPSPDHEWNQTTKRWILKPEIQAKAAARTEALAALARLDAQTVRALREMALGDPKAHDRLASIDAQIQCLRGNL